MQTQSRKAPKCDLRRPNVLARAEAGAGAEHERPVDVVLDRDLAEAFGVDVVQSAVVTEVAPESVAWRAGLRAGDVILSVDSQPVTTPAGLFEVALSGDGSLLLNVRRGNGALFILIRWAPKTTARIGWPRVRCAVQVPCRASVASLRVERSACSCFLRPPELFWPLTSSSSSRWMAEPSSPRQVVPWGEFWSMAPFSTGCGQAS